MPKATSSDNDMHNIASQRSILALVYIFVAVYTCSTLSILIRVVRKYMGFFGVFCVCVHEKRNVLLLYISMAKKKKHLQTEHKLLEIIAMRVIR